MIGGGGGKGDERRKIGGRGRKGEKGKEEWRKKERSRGREEGKLGRQIVGKIRTISTAGLWNFSIRLERGENLYFGETLEYTEKSMECARVTDSKIGEDRKRQWRQTNKAF